MTALVAVSTTRPLRLRVPVLVVPLLAALSVPLGTALESGRLNPRRYPALLSRQGHVSNREIGVEATVYSASEEVYFSSRDSYPVLYPAPSKQNLVFCIPQKVGSTRWKNLLYRGRGDADADKHGYGRSFSQLIHTVRAPWTFESSYDSREKIVAKILEPSSLRFMWVRNPYVRVLSGFLDKICSQREWMLRSKMWAEYRLWLGNGTEFSCTPEDFYRYVNALVAARDAGVEINPHLDVQANLCGLLQGVQYDFYLKVEEEDIWYPEFISLAGLEDAARNNWSFETNIRAHTTMKHDVPDCFLELPGMTCEETDAYIRKLGDYTGSHPSHRAASREAQWMNELTTTHAAGTSSKMQTYYATWEIVDIVTAYVRPDLIAFSYPVMEL